MLRSAWLAALAAVVSGADSLNAQTTVSPAATADVYGQFEFLIGDWHSRPADGTELRQSFRWGPKRSYILYSTYLATSGRPEQLHFEGIMVWNGRSKALDFLFAIEPGSGAQESGTVRAQADGSIVREVQLTSSEGRVGRFRQTFRRTGASTAVTSLMRQADTGWEPTFPGSAAIIMTRQPG